MKVKSLSRVRLFCCLPGSSIRGILQARILEWVAISFPNYCLRKWKKWTVESLPSWNLHSGRRVSQLTSTYALFKKSYEGEGEKKAIKGREGAERRPVEEVTLEQRHDHKKAWWVMWQVVANEQTWEQHQAETKGILKSLVQEVRPEMILEGVRGQPGTVGSLGGVYRHR